jgi:hypothetical protein
VNASCRSGRVASIGAGKATDGSRVYRTALVGMVSTAHRMAMLTAHTTATPTGPMIKPFMAFAENGERDRC